MLNDEVFDEFKTTIDINNFIFDHFVATGKNPKELLLTKDCFEQVRPWHVHPTATEFTMYHINGDVVIKMYTSNVKPKNTNKDPNKCCDNPKIVQNQVFFEIFYVCQNCKKETTKEGKPV